MEGLFDSMRSGPAPDPDWVNVMRKLTKKELGSMSDEEISRRLAATKNIKEKKDGSN